MNEKPKIRCGRCEKVTMTAYPLNPVVLKCRYCGHVELIKPEKTIPLKVEENNKAVA